jgi:HipA-like kinase
MSTPTPVFEAKRWVEKTASGGSRSQVFELKDGRYAVVKFLENPQGERVLVNEFICCSVAEALELPVNHAVLVSIDGRLLKEPQESGECPKQFTAGICCGLVRYPDAVHITHDQLASNVENSDEMHMLNVFDALVARGNGRQLLAYPEQPQQSRSKKLFAAIDYGFAFGGTPAWTVDNFQKLAVENPFKGLNDDDGHLIEPLIDRLRNFTETDIEAVLSKIYPPRWGASAEEIEALFPILATRKRALVDQFEIRFKKQLEVFHE